MPTSAVQSFRLSIRLIFIDELISVGRHGKNKKFNKSCYSMSYVIH